MPKLKTNTGYRFIKELGGAIKHKTLSKTAQFLVDKKLVKGKVLDYGCGYGYDADTLGWDAYDPYYRQKPVVGPYDTISCNHVPNILTRESRQELFKTLQDLLAPGGTAYITVTRKVPMNGKLGLRKRIQNYVVLTLPSLYKDDEMEIYRMDKGVSFEDRTDEIQDRLKRN